MKSYKTSGDLKKLLDADKSGRLLPAVKKWILAMPPGDRDYTYLHPSDLCKDNWCARAAYFNLRGHTKPHEHIQFPMFNVFEEGHLIHAKWQRYFSRMGNLYGTFYDGDGDPYNGIVRNPEDTYREVWLSDPDSMIRGKSDGWIVGIGDDCLIEIKSVGLGTLRFEAPGLLTSVKNDANEAWKEIKRPFPSHLRQGQIYLELAHRMDARGMLDRPAPNEIVFIYEYKPTQEVKEFVVKYSPESSARFFTRAESVAKAARDGIEPECSINHDTCSLCKDYHE